MNPHVSVSIIIFYISIAINLFIIYAVSKDKKEVAARLGGFGVLGGFLIGSFLFINIFAVKLFVASIPIVIAGLVEDTKKTKNPAMQVALILFSAILGALMCKNELLQVTRNFQPLYAYIILITASFVATYAFIFGFGFINKGVLKWSVVPVFIFFSYIFHKIGNKEIFEAALLITVSTAGALCLDFPLKKAFLKKTWLYFSGFIFSELSIAVLTYLIK